MFLFSNGYKPDGTVHGHFDQRKTGTYGSKQQLGHPEAVGEGHNKADNADESQSDQHGIPVADAGDVGRNKEGNDGNAQVFVGLQDRCGTFRHTKSILDLEYNGTYAVQQYGKYKIVEEKRGFDFPR